MLIVYIAVVEEDFARARYAISCDGIPSCEDLDDECNTTLCGNDLPSYCKYVEGSNGYVYVKIEF